MPGASQRSCWNCGACLPVPLAGGPSYCAACQASTGVGLNPSPGRGWMWKRADGVEVLELYLNHAEVHAPSPA